MASKSSELGLVRFEIEASMLALGIDIFDDTSCGLVGKREAQMWRYIRKNCTEMQQLFQGAANSYMQVVALREAQASNAQAKLVWWLTTLGTFGVPLSVISGIMSMGGDFMPGEARFWVYLAVVVPLSTALGLLLIGLTKHHTASKWWANCLLGRRNGRAKVKGDKRE